MSDLSEADVLYGKEYNSKGIYAFEDVQAKKEQNLEYHQGQIDPTERNVKYLQDQVKQTNRQLRMHRDDGKALSLLRATIDNLDLKDPKQKALAEKAKEAFNQTINNELITRTGKKVSFDLDGSKKTFWGRMKNKIKNKFKPFNAKLRLESALEEFRHDISRNYAFYEGLKVDISYDGNGNKINNPEFSYDTITKAQDKKDSRLVERIYNDEQLAQMAERLVKANTSKIIEDKKELAQIAEIKDNAAYKIETKQTARDNIGLNDIRGNTGVDKLAERAKAMEGMTSEQRRDYRISLLRGTIKETPSAPVTPRKVDPKIAAKATEKQK